MEGEYFYITDNEDEFFQKWKVANKQSLFDKVNSLFEIAQSGG